MLVTENVFRALKRLRNGKGRQRLLWIDAVCINQNDQVEKSIQVSMMEDIFARAQRVNTWLSKPTEEMTAAFKMIQRIADATERSTGAANIHDRMHSRIQLLLSPVTLADLYRASINAERRPGATLFPSLLDQGLDCARGCIE